MKNVLKLHPITRPDDGGQPQQLRQPLQQQHLQLNSPISVKKPRITSELRQHLKPPQLQQHLQLNHDNFSNWTNYSFYTNHNIYCNSSNLTHQLLQQNQTAKPQLAAVETTSILAVMIWFILELCFYPIWNKINDFTCKCTVYVNKRQRHSAWREHFIRVSAFVKPFQFQNKLNGAYELLCTFSNKTKVSLISQHEFLLESKLN